MTFCIFFIIFHQKMFDSIQITLLYYNACHYHLAFMKINFFNKTNTLPADSSEWIAYYWNEEIMIASHEIYYNFRLQRNECFKNIFLGMNIKWKKIEFNCEMAFSNMLIVDCSNIIWIYPSNQLIFVIRLKLIEFLDCLRLTEKSAFAWSISCSLTVTRISKNLKYKIRKNRFLIDVIWILSTTTNNKNRRSMGSAFCMSFYKRKKNMKGILVICVIEMVW